MIIIRAADLVRVPWKNGGGTTSEIAVHPPGAGFDDFDWRISMADVASDGPFSRFPGINRTLVVLEGAGITLTINGRAEALTGPGAMLSFDGEATTAGTLIDGPIRDFNVMTRRGQFRAEVFHLPAHQTPPMGTPAIILALIDGTRIGGETLDRYDSAIDSSGSADQPTLAVSLLRV